MNIDKLCVDVPPEEWRKYTFKEKLAYFKQKLINSKGDIGDSILKNVEEIMETLRNGTQEDSIARKYTDLGCLALKAMKFTSFITDKFTREKIKISGQYDYILKYLDADRENLYVDELSINNEIIRAFVESMEDLAKRGVFRLDKTEYETKTKGDPFTSINFILTWGENYIGIEDLKFFIHCDYTVPNASKKQQLVSNNGNILIAFDYSVLDNYDFDNYEDVVRLVLLEALSSYVKTLDIKHNFIKLEPYGDMRPMAKTHVNFDINNFNMKAMIDTMKKCISKGKHRGYMFLGDPGTGKTASIFKLLEEFDDIPVFWIDSSNIATATSVKDIYKTLHYFPKSICVFDDIDAINLSEKSPMTTAFIECMDNKDDTLSYGGITIMTVNDPLRVNSSIKTRSERIDQIIYIKNPNTREKVFDIIKQRYVNADEEMPSIFSLDNEKFITGVDKCIDNNFTHAHIASIIDDIIILNEDLDYGAILDEFHQLIDDRIDSLKYANMKIKDGYFERTDIKR